MNFKKNAVQNKKSAGSLLDQLKDRSYRTIKWTEELMCNQSVFCHSGFLAF